MLTTSCQRSSSHPFLTFWTNIFTFIHDNASTFGQSCFLSLFRRLYLPLKWKRVISGSKGSKVRSHPHCSCYALVLHLNFDHFIVWEEELLMIKVSIWVLISLESFSSCALFTFFTTSWTYQEYVLFLSYDFFAHPVIFASSKKPLIFSRWVQTVSKNSKQQASNLTVRHCIKRGEFEDINGEGKGGKA